MMTAGGLGTGLSVGVPAGVSVKLGVGVKVGGGGVEELAPAVWVSITTASCAAVVPITSATEVGVAFGVHDEQINAIASPVMIPR